MKTIIGAGLHVIPIVEAARELLEKFSGGRRYDLPDTAENNTRHSIQGNSIGRIGVIFVEEERGRGHINTSRESRCEFIEQLIPAHRSVLVS